MLCFMTDPLLQNGGQKSVYVTNVLSLGIAEKGSRKGSSHGRVGLFSYLF